MLFVALQFKYLSLEYQAPGLLMKNQDQDVRSDFSSSRLQKLPDGTVTCKIVFRIPKGYLFCLGN